MVEKRDPSNRNRIKSLNFEKRKKEQSSIHEENLRLLNRISQKKSDYQKKSLDK